MLNLDVYSFSQLNSTLNILKQSIKKGLDINESISYLENAINKEIKKVRKNNTENQENDTIYKKQRMCKKCNKPMTYCMVTSAFHCKCGFSELDT